MQINHLYTAIERKIENRMNLPATSIFSNKSFLISPKILFPESEDQKLNSQLKSTNLACFIFKETSI